MEEVVQWIEENKLHICHDVTVDDLHHLHHEEGFQGDGSSWKHGAD